MRNGSPNRRSEEAERIFKEIMAVNNLKILIYTLNKLSVLQVKESYPHLDTPQSNLQK